MIAIDTIAVENEVARNMYERSELDYLIYNAPLEYADLILNGDPETYLKTVTEYKSLDSWTFSLPAGKILRAIFVYRKPRHSGGVENSLSDEQNSLMC